MPSTSSTYSPPQHAPIATYLFPISTSQAKPIYQKTIISPFWFYLSTIDTIVFQLFSLLLLWSSWISWIAFGLFLIMVFWIWVIWFFTTFCLSMIIMMPSRTLTLSPVISSPYDYPQIASTPLNAWYIPQWVSFSIRYNIQYQCFRKSVINQLRVYDKIISQ